VHTSAKACLTSVAIWIQIRIRIRDRDPDRHQSLIICSLAHCQPSLKISCKSVWTFCAKLLTNRQTDKQRRKHNLLGAGNNNNNKKLVRGWESERKLFTATSSTTFTQCASEASEFGEITQNKTHHAVQGHSRSPILIPIESSYTTSH